MYKRVVLFYFMKLYYRGLDLERASIITGGLRRVAVTCRESTSSCAALAASGIITKILIGFKSVFTNDDPRYRGNSNICKKVFIRIYLLNVDT